MIASMSPMGTDSALTSGYLLQFVFFGALLNTYQAYWIRDLSYCPRKREAGRQRQCFKSCFDDSDCRSRYRSCVCDYDCGMSCVKRGVSCPSLAAPEHGTIRYSNGNKFGSRATYECDQGYALEGSKHRNCQGDMWWGPTDSIPYCTKEVFCSRPPDINNAVNDIPSTITTFHAGYSVKYTCLTGYAGNGTTTSECTFLGQWTFATLKCTPVDCGSPGLLRNGFLSGERFDYPNIIAFFCHEGYELIGKDSTRACQENGLWSGTMPLCQQKTCGSPPIVAHGEMIQPDRTSNVTVQYVCQEGYQLNGSAILKCISSQWQPSTPTCQVIACFDPQTKFSGAIEPALTNHSSTYSIGSVVHFRCPSNQTLKGSPKSQCQTNGSWSSDIPTCQKSILCPAPSLPPRARYVDSLRPIAQINDGSYVEYTCGNSRHRQRIFCRQGKIVPRMPRCFQGCRTKNGSVTFSKSFYRHREKIEFTCPTKINPLKTNNETIICLNGSLSNEPQCPTDTEQSMCTVPHMLFLRHIANSTMPSGAMMGIGTSFSYTCAQDHQPAVDTAMVECLSDGTWSHHAQCVPISCRDHPPTVDHGRTMFRSTTHGSVARFRCFPGYQLESNHSAVKLTCQFGLWLPKQFPRCLPIFCPNPGPLLNGRTYVVLNDERISSKPIRSEFRPHIPNISHGRAIEFDCHSGYLLHGPTGLTCNHGQWMPSERPRCIRESHAQPDIIFTG